MSHYLLESFYSSFLRTFSYIVKRIDVLFVSGAHRHKELKACVSLLGYGKRGVSLPLTITYFTEILGICKKYFDDTNRNVLEWKI